MYKHYDLLCRKLQRIKLKFNLNHDPSRQGKDTWTAPSTPTPAPPGWAWTAHILGIEQEPGAAPWTRAEVAGGQPKWAFATRQCDRNCLPPQSPGLPNNPSGKCSSSSHLALQETEAGGKLMPCFFIQNAGDLGCEPRNFHRQKAGGHFGPVRQPAPRPVLPLKPRPLAHCSRKLQGAETPGPCPVFPPQCHPACAQ